MTLCLHSARDPFRMAGILNEVHNRISKATDSRTAVDEWTQNTLYWIADAYFQLNDLASAEKIYKEFVLQAPQSPLVPYALEALAATLSAQGPTRDGEAVIALQQAELRARDLGNKDFAEQMEVELAKVYYNQRDFQSRRDLEPSGQVSTQTAVRTESLFREGDALSRAAILSGSDQALENAGETLPRQPLGAGRPDAHRQYAVGSRFMAGCRLHLQHAPAKLSAAASMAKEAASSWSSAPLTRAMPVRRSTNSWILPNSIRMTPAFPRRPITC